MNGSSGAATKQGARSGDKTKTSYLRPNRDYTKHITLSYELNKDIYNIYKEAEPGRTGYMKRMKDVWDQIHPEHKHLTNKHLREQALQVIQKKLTKETGLQPEQDTTNCQNEDVESIHDSSRSINIQMNQQNEILADTITKGENTVNIESDKFKELIQKWAKSLEKYERLRLDEREYETLVNRTIKRDTMKNINFIVGQHLDRLHMIPVYHYGS